jgi:Na+/H+ antiporter NhaD/arsenite permease-like protein
MVALAKVDNDVEAAAPAQSISQSAPAKKHTGMKLERGDAVYFLMTLACSSNIGSALTYTGNPQNMIVAQDAIDVLPPIQFLAVMIIPSLVTWLMSK